MNIEIEDYSKFANITKYAELTDNIIMLPIDYDYQDSKKCLFDKHDLNIVKKFRVNKLSASLIESDHKKILYLQNNGISWISPTFLIANQVLTNPDLITTVLKIIELYVTEIFSENSKEISMTCNFVYKETTTYKTIKYSGHPSWLSEIAKIIQANQTKN
jgi:hypothetical protein